MSMSADAVLLILQSRLDYLSARTVLKQAANDAGLDAAGPFLVADVEKLATSLLASGPRMAGVVENLRKAGGPGSSSKAAQAEAAPAAKAEPAPAKAAPKAEDHGAPPPAEEALRAVDGEDDAKLADNPDEASEAADGKGKVKAKASTKKS